MAKIVVNQKNIDDIDEAIKLCPFGAIEWNEDDRQVQISAACKMCMICVNKGPEGAFELEEDEVFIDKSLWKGVSVYVDHDNGEIHPVTYELIGKARELADKINHPVFAVFIGSDIKDKADELLHYGVDEVFVYDDEAFKDFRVMPYTAAFADFIEKVSPSAVLVGATTLGRSLAPRVAARFKTGLTADCTILDIKENTDLVQIRPAFGGNIMAQICTPKHRPQFATVRYKIMNAPERMDEPQGEITYCSIPENISSQVNVLSTKEKEVEEDIADAEVIVVAGRAIKKEEDLKMVHELAKELGGKVAVTRPLIEAGWGDPKTQIGLSGRTVRPKLIITCGVSGSVQFKAGMTNSEYIFAINKDANAPIFQVAHYGIVGDVYDVIPELLAKIKQSEEVTA
jgi:electron transfer flavoprotein alpha subunit